MKKILMIFIFTTYFIFNNMYIFHVVNWYSRLF